VSAPQSLFDAMIQQLRATTAVTAAFGDTWNATLASGIPANILANVQAGNICKFWSDEAGQIANVLVGDPVQPYLVFEEVGERYEFMTPINGAKPFIAPGVAICRIIATSRATARGLGLAVCSALNDMDTEGVTWPGETIASIPNKLMMLRMGQASFDPNPKVGPGMSSAFNRVIAFDYEYQGSI
jgi:hypothetical protein